MDAFWLAVIFASGGLLAILCALRTLKWRDGPGTLLFVGLLLCGAWWGITRALEMFADDISAKMFWAQIAYLGIAPLPVFWFLATAAYSGKTQWLARRNFFLFALYCSTILIAVATNPWHHWFWTTATMGEPPQSNLILTHGILFWFFVTIHYALMIAGTVMVLRSVLRSHKLYRRQILLLVLAVFIPWTANALFLAGLFSLNGSDPTPLAILLTGILWVAALYGNRLFDLVPVARDALVEEMSDGVIVLDRQNRIVDANHAALEILERNDKEWIGKPAQQTLQELPAWATGPGKDEQGDIELKTPEGKTRHVHVRLSALNPQFHSSRRLLILQDVTERKNVEHELHRANHHLQKQLEEIKALQATLQEQAIRDPLTGLHNRRFLHEMLSKEFGQSVRTHQPMSLIVLDIDHFKSFNDTYGHLAGDVMLKALGDWLCTKTRRGDLICRYGGEEFVVLLPGASIEVGEIRALEWCAGFRELDIWHNDMMLHTTLSLGVAAYPLHGATPMELLHEADMAMYAAKQAGRNCVCVAEITSGLLAVPNLLPKAT